MSQPPRSKAALWAMGLGVFAFALLCGIAASLLDVWRAERATRWPTTTGTVVESRYHQGCGRKGTGYFTTVRYRYDVGGVPHASGRILFGAAHCDSQRGAQATTERYPVGAAVKVHHDPQAPAEATLIAGQVDASTWQGIYFLAFLFVLVAAATGMVTIVARSEGRPVSRRPSLPPRDEGR